MLACRTLLEIWYLDSKTLFCGVATITHFAVLVFFKQYSDHWHFLLLTEVFGHVGNTLHSKTNERMILPLHYFVPITQSIFHNHKFFQCFCKKACCYDLQCSINSFSYIFLCRPEGPTKNQLLTWFKHNSLSFGLYAAGFCRYILGRLIQYIIHCSPQASVTTPQTLFLEAGLHFPFAEWKMLHFLVAMFMT